MKTETTKKKSYLDLNHTDLRILQRDYLDRLYNCSNNTEGREIRKELESRILKIEKLIDRRKNVAAQK